MRDESSRAGPPGSDTWRVSYHAVVRTPAQPLRRAVPMASARVALAVRRLAASTKSVGKRHMSGGSYEEEVGARWPCAALLAWCNRGCRCSGDGARAPATPRAARSRCADSARLCLPAEMNKWRSITMVAAPGCALLAGYMMLNAEHHHEEKIVRAPGYRA